MSTTKEDVILSGAWVELYDAAAITPQAAITVTNKSIHDIYVCVYPTTPPSLTRGYPVRPYESVGVQSGDAAVWAIGEGPILVQLA